MDNGQYNSNNGNNNDNEEIRFDENDFQDQYSQFYSQYSDQPNADIEFNNQYTPPFEQPFGQQFDQPFGQQFGQPFEPPYEQVNFYEPSREDLMLPQINKAKKHFSRIGIGYMLFSIITLVVSSIIVELVFLINEDIYYSSLFLNALTPVCLYLFALPVLLIVLSGTEARAPEKKKLGFGKFLIILLVSFGCMYIGSYIGNYVMATLSEIMGYDYGNALDIIIDDDNIWITAIFTVIVAPIGEEFVFRKLIIDRTNKYGPVVSIVLSALMFGLMHGNFYQFFYCFAIGLILGYIYYSTGKLYITIAIHAIINFVGSVVTSLISPLIDPILEWAETGDTGNVDSMMSFLSENAVGIIVALAFALFVMASMACAIIFPIVFRKKLKLERGTEELPRGRVFEAVIRNGGIIAMFIIYFVEFGLNLLPQ